VNETSLRGGGKYAGEDLGDIKKLQEKGKKKTLKPSQLANG